MPSSDGQNTDRDYIKEVTRKMLQRLEHSLEVVANEAELALRLKAHELVFGAKASLASTLVTLADLLLSLEQKTTTPAAAEDILSPSQSLSAGDVALVEAFVRKIKFSAATTPSLKGDLFS